MSCFSLPRDKNTYYIKTFIMRNNRHYQKKLSNKDKNCPYFNLDTKFKI